MSHLNYTPKSKKGQHLSYEERQKIEILLKAKHKPEEIGKLLGGRSKRTIQREIALGKVKLLNSDLTYRAEYSADAAQNKRDFNNTAKGPRLKLGANFKLIEFIENKIIKDKYSPAAALAEVRKKGYEVNFCVKTLYNYIDEGLFAKLTNDDLPVKMQLRKGYIIMLELHIFKKEKAQKNAQKKPKIKKFSVIGSLIRWWASRKQKQHLW